MEKEYSKINDFNAKYEDNLTKLPNRFAAKLYMKSLMDKYPDFKQTSLFAIYNINIRRFSFINDTYYDEVGDKVLIEISNRLRNLASKNGSKVYRIDGDKFGLVSRPEISMEEIKTLANEIVSISKEKFIIDDLSFNINLNIGIAVYPFDGENVLELIRSSNIAMNHIRYSDVTKTFAFYNKDDYEYIIKNAKIDVMMKKADYEKEFHLVFQPQFSVDKKLVGMEALLRWESEEGNIPPDVFIPLAERNGEIEEIDRWVLKKASCQIKHWRKKYNTDAIMGINVTTTELNLEDYAQRVIQYLEYKKIDPKFIDIEILESACIDEFSNTKKNLDILWDNNFNISIDDFGTGYSSLSYLAKHKVNRIKLDKGLIDDIVTNPEEKKVVQALINICLDLNFKVIAEGVETKEQLDMLCEMGCTQIQGYYLGRPVPAEEFEKLYFENSQNK